MVAGDWVTWEYEVVCEVVGAEDLVMSGKQSQIVKVGDDVELMIMKLLMQLMDE